MHREIRPKLGWRRKCVLASHSKAFFSHVLRLRVHDPPPIVPRLTGPESASPVESRFCHSTLWLFIADSRSLVPLADALRFSKQGSCYLCRCWIIWKEIFWKYGTTFNVWKHQTRFYWVSLFEIMVISLMPRSSTTKATTRHHNNHHHHHHRTIKQSDFFFFSCTLHMQKATWSWSSRGSLVGKKCTMHKCCINIFIWASAKQKQMKWPEPSSEDRLAWTFAQSDQSLRCTFHRKLRTTTSFVRMHRSMFSPGGTTPRVGENCHPCDKMLCPKSPGWALKFRCNFF